MKSRSEKEWWYVVDDDSENAFPYKFTDSSEAYREAKELSNKTGNDYHVWHIRYVGHIKAGEVFPDKALIGRKIQLGDLVIVRNNEDDHYAVGTLVGYDNAWHDPSREQFPVVALGGTLFFCMGIVVKYTKELCDLLDTMTPKDQWNYLSEHYKKL